MLHPNWLQGFIDGEGSFQFDIGETRNRGKFYFRTNPTLEISQSNHDVLLLEIIKNFMNSGYIKPKFNIYDFVETINSRNVSRYVNGQENMIIDFIDKYPLETSKDLDYKDWKRLINIKEQGLHKTIEGRETIIEIKSKINKGRKF